MADQIGGPGKGAPQNKVTDVSSNGPGRQKIGLFVCVLFLCGFEGILLIVSLLNLVTFYLLGVAGARTLAQVWRSKGSRSLLSPCGANDRAEVIRLGSQGLCPMRRLAGPVSGVWGF